MNDSIFPVRRHKSVNRSPNRSFYLPPEPPKDFIIKKVTKIELDKECRVKVAKVFLNNNTLLLSNLHTLEPLSHLIDEDQLLKRLETDETQLQSDNTIRPKPATIDVPSISLAKPNGPNKAFMRQYPYLKQTMGIYLNINAGIPKQRPNPLGPIIHGSKPKKKRTNSHQFRYARFIEKGNMTLHTEYY